MAVLALGTAACHGGSAEPLITYFNPEHALSLQYPASWKTEQAQQPPGPSGASDNTWYRYFLAPPTSAAAKPLAVTLVAGPLGVPLDQYAQAYLAGNTVQSTQGEQRPGASGKSWILASADGKARYALLLLQEGAEARAGLPPAPAPAPAPVVAASWVYGLYAQGSPAAFDAQRGALDAMMASFALERPARYPEERNDKYAFALRVPPSWRATRTFASATTYLQQYASPALGADKRETIHGSLTLTVEALGPGATVDTFYKSTMDKLGDAFVVLTHAAWRGGYVDVLHWETGIAESRGKRYYRVADGRGYTLAFDARDDIYTRGSRWCDMIVATLKVGAEVTGS